MNEDYRRNEKFGLEYAYWIDKSRKNGTIEATIRRILLIFKYLLVGQLLKIALLLHYHCTTEKNTVFHFGYSRKAFCL